MPAVTHEVDQTLEVNLSHLSEEDRNAVIECHKKPDVYVADDSFPGEMTCRIDTCFAEESSETAGSFTLKRKLYFDFTWDDEDAMSEWEEDNTATDEAILPSYVAGDYEGIFIGDDMHDYQTEYLGASA